MKYKRLINIIAGTGLVVLAASATVSAVVIDKIVVVVNGEVITQREVAQYLFPLYEEYQKEYTGKNLDDKMLEANDMIMDQLIQDKLILSEAKKAGIKADDDEVDARVNKIIKEKFDSSEEKFREMLAIQNISLNEMRDALRNEIIKSKIVREKVGYKVTITPSEVRQYYDQHIAEFVEPEKAEVLNILVRKKEGGEEKAKELIRKVKALLDAGQDFEAAAKKYSEGPNAKGGGNMGLIKRGEMMTEIDGAIFSIPAGSVSDIVETPIGYHIFKVTQIVPARSKDFDSAKAEIEDTIYQKKINKNLEKWLKELKENAYISVK
ncbi:MAG: peptidyl-prolyl cis-trans isomerase [Candidatus Omnitrophota bacterium]|nr:peptidyl-prolyl cis-trans isomerase [Candidatus Omnitrophota bacterium]